MKRIPVGPVERLAIGIDEIHRVDSGNLHNQERIEIDIRLNADDVSLLLGELAQRLDGQQRS
jgi:hypothetical protein